MLSGDFIDVTIENDEEQSDSMEEMQAVNQPSFANKCSLWIHSQFNKVRDVFLHGDQDSTSGDSTELDIMALPESDFVIKRLLGKGTFSRVMLCEDLKSHKESAVKLISIAEIVKNQALEASVRGEIRMMRGIGHTHIASFKGVIRMRDCVGIVMEYCPGGDLFSLVSREGKLREDLVKDVTRQLISAVKYLHSQGIAHRDIKLENILLMGDGSSLAIKLADLGLAHLFLEQVGKGMDSGQVSGVQMLHTRCGSKEYAAPEILRGIPYDGRVSDAWSVGIVIYACLFGTLPFTWDDKTEAGPCGGGKKRLCNKICSGVFRVPNETPISEDCRRVLYALLRVIPEDRMTLNELEQHPWLAQKR